MSWLVQLYKGLINPAPFWRSPMGRCHGNQLKSQNLRFSPKKFFVALPFRNGLEYRNANGQLRSALNLATWYTNMVRFGAVTPEKRLLIFVLLWKKCKNGHIWPIISEHARPILTNYSALNLIDIWVGIINLTFVLRSLKGRFSGNQFEIWGTFCKHRI